VFENLLQALLDCIRQVMAVDTITVLLQTEGGQQLFVRATLGLGGNCTRDPNSDWKRLCRPLTCSRELMIVEDLSKVEIVSPILRNKGIRSMVGIRCWSKKGSRGLPRWYVPFCQFTSDDVQLLAIRR